MGLEADRKGIQLAIDWALDQKIVPRRLSVDELFDEVTGSLLPEIGLTPFVVEKTWSPLRSDADMSRAAALVIGTVCLRAPCPGRPLVS
jgi:hypothetical protein